MNSGNGLVQRKRGGPSNNSTTDSFSPNSEYDEEYKPSSTAPTTPPNEDDSPELKVDDDGFTDQDLEGKKVKLTLMEEVLLIGLRDEQGWYAWWNENMSYVLRGCMLAELAMRGRVDVFKEVAGRHHRKPFTDRLIDVITEKHTGEVLLDEALKIMRMEQSTDDGKPSQRFSINQWVDLLSGETWNLLKYSYQMKLVRERLSKGLVDKGVLRTEKKNFLVFEMTTHPVADPHVKAEIINRVVSTLMGKGSPPTRRTILLCCAAYAANVMENALSSANSLGMSLNYSQKEACLAKCEELLSEWSGSGAEIGSKESLSVLKSIKDKNRIGWNEFLTGVVGVFAKLDTVL